MSVRCPHGSLCGGLACCCRSRHRVEPTWLDRVAAFLHHRTFVTFGTDYLTDRSTGRFLTAPRKADRQ
jgi:hypothetical protein